MATIDQYLSNKNEIIKNGIGDALFNVENDLFLYLDCGHFVYFNSHDCMWIEAQSKTYDRLKQTAEYKNYIRKRKINEYRKRIL
jgi:chaperone required for assembly of F1-ATPase